MLCGVGGSTVEEAKENLSFEELLAWGEMRRRFGSFNVAWRTEYETGKLYALFWNYVRDAKKWPKGKELDEFLEHPPQRQEVAETEAIADTQAIIALLGARPRKKG